MDTSTQLRLDYLTGFANAFETEALPGALPRGRNSPQQAPYGLYAEKLSGTAFTAPRESNRQSWLYRIRPSVVHGEFLPANQRLLRGYPYDSVAMPPNQMRWDPLPLPQTATDFVDGLATIAGTSNEMGCAVHIYTANTSMTERFFFDADGELLIVPQEGRLLIASEMGLIGAAPGEIAVVPRGIKFRVELPDGPSRGYVCENFGALLRLPELGPIGSNGLANARDFCTPVAAYEDRDGSFTLTAKFDGRLWSAAIDHSPLDVVAWHGNYAPYKYDLARFNAIGSVSFDHPDPSIYTVLTSPSEVPGTANVDFVIFPPRWLVAENTYRPPWFHRNVMSEFMGLVRGVYDGRAEGFVPGGASLHNRMAAHGNDAQVFEAASKAKLDPVYLGDTLAFMFETRHVYRATRFALETPARQKDYLRVWQTLRKHFDGKRSPPK